MYITQPDQRIISRVFPFIFVFLLGTAAYILIHLEGRFFEKAIIIVFYLFVIVELLFEAGRLTRRYFVDQGGVTAIWYGHWKMLYRWEDFVSVERSTVFTSYGSRQIDCIICSIIPIKKETEYQGQTAKTFVSANWIGTHPFKVLDIPLTEEQLEEFWRYVPASLHPAPDNHTD